MGTTTYVSFGVLGPILADLNVNLRPKDVVEDRFAGLVYHFACTVRDARARLAAARDALYEATDQFDRAWAHNTVNSELKLGSPAAEFDDALVAYDAACRALTAAADAYNRARAN
jgi:hypothetical protein